MSPIPSFAARLLLGLALSAASFAGAGKVTLSVTRVPAGTPAEARLTLGSNVNGWNPADARSVFTKNADGTSSLSLDVPDGTLLEYKVTRGAWASVEKNADGSEMANRSLKVQGDATVKIEVAAWADGGTGTAAATTTAAAPAADPPKVRMLSRAPVTAASSWWANAAFYQVFVRSFQDSDGDGVGDFRGLTSRLDYLKNLGVRALWLMPIYPSPSYHGYDVTDYRNVNPDYGTLADFDAFLKAAHARGIRVILDWVPNHSSREHSWFQAALDPKNAKRDWYLWRDQNPGWGQPWGSMGNVWHRAGDAYYYGAFWEGMPDLNWRNPQVKAALNDAAAFWLKRGVDGFRVDAVRYVVENRDDNTPDNPENLAWMRDFEKFVKGLNKNAAVVGEAWTSTQGVAKYLLNGVGEDMAFDFDLRDALLAGVRNGDPAPVQAALDQVTALYPKGSVDAIFTTNHDMVRPEYAGPAQAKTAASLLLTLPGTPFIYYGEEIGLPNGPGGADEHKRTPMRWTAAAAGAGAGFTTGRPWYAFSTDAPGISVEAQGKDPASLLNHYRRLLALRAQHPALRSGGYVPLLAGNGVLAFARHQGRDVTVVAVNLGNKATPVKLNLTRVPLALRGAVTDAWSGRKLADVGPANAGAYPVGLEANGLAVLTFRLD